MTTIYIKSNTVLPDRSNNDLYITELPLIEAAMDYAAPPSRNAVLDIGAGDGRWGRIAADRTGPDELVGVELEDQPVPDGFTGWYPNTDYLTWEPEPRQFDFIVSNPPYALAEPIIRRAWDQLAPNGTMVMLLRLAFMEGVGRFWSLWKDIYPYKVGVLSRRPSFYGAGRTNGTAFALYCWWKNSDGTPWGEPRSWRTDLVLYERDQSR